MTHLQELISVHLELAISSRIELMEESYKVFLHVKYAR
jgi:hypothetical protein